MVLLFVPILGWGDNHNEQCDPIYLTYTNIKLPDNEILDFTLK